MTIDRMCELAKELAEVPHEDGLCAIHCSRSHPTVQMMEDAFFKAFSASEIRFDKVNNAPGYKPMNEFVAERDGVTFFTLSNKEVSEIEACKG